MGNRPGSPSGALIVPGGSKGSIAVVQPAVEAGKAFLSENTKRAYFRDWMDFFGVTALEAITPAMALGVTPDQVADFRDQCLERGLGPGTVNRKLSSVRAFFDQMILRGVMAVNPAHPKLVRSPKKGNVRKMEALDASEAAKFLGAIDRATPLGRRDYAAIMLDLHMGLRRSEVLAIRAEQFKVAQGEAYILFRSKGEKERMITVNKDLAEALAEYAQDRGNAPGWLFPGKDPEKHLSGDQFWRIVQKYLELAGITKKVGTHGLRATFITHNLASGTPLDQIQKTVGHSRGETTLGYARDLEMIKSRAPKAMEGFGRGES
jgi:integrase/recombinase XerD